METLARDTDADMVLNAMVGAVGLGPSLAALQSGKTLALANKESLVVGGELIMDLVKGEPDRLVPVDSEHSALAQCLRGERREDLRRVIVTASGGPFRGWTRDELAKASVREALAHPTWNMGPKITIDSATLMNKGLEVIEAHYLFQLPYNKIDVVVHPESVVHGIAEFADGSMVAQLAGHDMRLPIQLALAYPERLGAGIAGLDLASLGRLSFEALDREAFPAVDLAYRAGRMGSTYPAVLNAANEVAVHRSWTPGSGWCRSPRSWPRSWTSTSPPGSCPRSPSSGPTAGPEPGPRRSSPRLGVAGVRVVRWDPVRLPILLVIVIHEGGHFTLAKLFGIKVEEFFVGFGPRLWSFRRGETEYGVKALPFGGYVRIAGMNPYEDDGGGGSAPDVRGQADLATRPGDLRRTGDALRDRLRGADRVLRGDRCAEPTGPVVGAVLRHPLRTGLPGKTGRAEGGRRGRGPWTGDRSGASTTSSRTPAPTSGSP